MTPGLRKWLLRLIKLAVCGGALWYLSDKVAVRDYVRLASAPDRQLILVAESEDTLRVRDPETGEENEASRTELATPDQLAGSRRGIERGLASVARQTDPGWAFWALLAMGPGTFIMAWRLRLLLVIQEIRLSLRDAVWLTFAGNFFNFAMPGTTGGDLYKAYHVARQTKRRTEGVTIVLLDRVIGLVSFLLLATCTIAFYALTRGERLGQYGWWVGYLMVGFIVFALLFFSRRVRKWIRYDALLARLPFGDRLRRIDDTAFQFRFHSWRTLLALLGTLVNHFFMITSIYFLALALGVHPHEGHTSIDLYLASLLATSVGFLLAAVPVSIQGFGLFEAVFYRVFVEGGWCSATEMLALTLSMRLVQIVWSLPGIAVPWLGFARPEEGATPEPPAP